jgi:hypothetical protein
MGKSIVITYIVRKSRNKEFLAPFFPKKDGKPTSDNLSKWRNAFNDSLCNGGTNEHLGINARIQCNIEIYNQVTESVMCTYIAPMFEVIG